MQLDPRHDVRVSYGQHIHSPPATQMERDRRVMPYFHGHLDEEEMVASFDDGRRG